MRVGHILQNKGEHTHGIGAQRPLLDAVRLMMHHRVGSLVVLDESERLLGIVTERDVLATADRYDGDMARVAVREVMSPDLVTCGPQDTLDHAMDLMLRNKTGRRIRHLPVLEDDALRGVISIGDVVQALLTETAFENKLLRNYIKNWPEPGS